MESKASAHWNIAGTFCSQLEQLPYLLLLWQSHCPTSLFRKVGVYTLAGLESKQFWFVNNALTKYYDGKTGTLVNNQMQNGTSVAFSLIMAMENTSKKCNLTIHCILLNASCFQGFRIVFCFSPSCFQTLGNNWKAIKLLHIFCWQRSVCYQGFICSFNKYFLHTYYVPGILLCIEDTAVNNSTRVPVFKEIKM